MKLTHFEQVVITATRTLPQTLVTTNPNVIGHRTPCGKFFVAITDNDIAIGKLNECGNPTERETFRFPYTNLDELVNYIQEFKRQYVESVL